MKKPRFVYKDVPTDNEFIEMMREINQRPCVFYDEPRYEEIEHINKIEIEYSYNGAHQDLIAILLHNGYEINAKIVGNVMEITWKDKPDLVDEVVQKIEGML